MQALSSTLKALEIGAPIATGPLTVFPLLRADAPPAAYALLDEALDAGLAEVTEISDGGSVPELLFRNKSDRDILLVDGEELVGAKQNRVLNLTILVGAFQEVKIPVSCVEASRWRGAFTALTPSSARLSWRNSTRRRPRRARTGTGFEVCAER